MLQVYDLKKRYGKIVALDGVSLNVSRGEILVIMGPSGCGKSTLIRCINRLTEPDSGELFFENRSIKDMSHGELLAFRRRVGFVFQHFNLIKRLSVKENVMLGPVLGGMEAKMRKEGLQALQKVGLGHQVDARPEELSVASSSGWGLLGL